MTDTTCLVCGRAAMEHRFRRRSPYLDRELEYDFRRCPDCGFVFAFGPADSETLERVYDKAFHGSSQQTAAVELAADWRHTARHSPVVANAIRRALWLHSLGLQGRLLDVGCGRGFSTRAAAEYFDVEGIELSVEAAAFAQSIGVGVRAGDILEADYPEASFDVITLWDALSSMTDPQALANKLSTLLKPQGALVLTAPDPGCRFARITHRYWPMLVPPVNLGYYTQASLRVLLEAVGCTITLVRYETKRVSVEFAARKLLRSLGLHGPAEAIPTFPSQWAVPMNFGDIVTVVAKKDCA